MSRKVKSGNRRTAVAEQRRTEKQANQRHAQHEIKDEVYRHGSYKNGRPKPYNPGRRNKYKYDLKGWLKAYMPNAYPLDFSDDHITTLNKLQQAILKGGNFAEAMPRGSGKSTMAEGANIWAMAYGHRSFLVIIGGSVDAAMLILEGIVGELEENEKIQADFPELAMPFEKLNGKSARAQYQILNGERTHIVMKRNRIECARVPNAPCSGSIITCVGLQGKVRGPNKKLEDGTRLRPDFVLLDDPQTDESAHSQTQTDSREGLIQSAVLNMAGPDKKIAGLLAGTVIEENDLMDRMLNPELHPEWNGERCSLVYRWPDTLDMWKTYANIRRRGLADGDGGQDAHKYYLDNREKMDKGAQVAWEQRYNIDEASALEHAYNLLIDLGEEAFYSEYQNQPKSSAHKTYELNIDTVAKNVNIYSVRQVPDNAVWVTGMTDINLYGLHWVITAVAQDMTGYVIDYGVYPERGDLCKPGSSEGDIAKAVYDGLTTLVSSLSDYRFNRPDARDALDLFLIDAGYQLGTVFSFAKQCRAPFRVIPDRGRPAKTYRQNKAIGDPKNNCHMTKYQGRGRVIEHNADYWRMAVQKAFLSNPGAPGSISLYNESPRHHRDFAEQITNEYLIEHVKGDVADYYSWGHVPGGKWDYLDALVGSMVAACMLGASWGGISNRQARKPKRRKPKIKPED